MAGRESSESRRGSGAIDRFREVVPGGEGGEVTVLMVGLTIVFLTVAVLAVVTLAVVIWGLLTAVWRHVRA